MSLVSRKWIGSAVLLLILVGLCIGLMNWRTERMIASAYESCGSPEPIHMAALGLNSEQKTKIQTLQRAYRARIIDLCARHCEQKAKLADLIKASPRDDGAIMTCSAEVARLQTEAEQATTEHILSMAGAMDEKQAEIFLRKFSQEIVKTCPIVFAPEAK